MESVTCLQKNPVSDAFAMAAVELIRDNLVKVVKNGKDEQGRLAWPMQPVWQARLSPTQW